MQALAAVFEGQPFQHQLMALPVPALKLGEVLVRVLGATICGSDRHTFEGRRQVPTPTILGHEIVGEIVELGDSVSQDLKDELRELVPPLDGVPGESEMRVAQAQLVGWLEGLFHGIQAAMFAQQMAARQQFEEIRRRGLMAQNPQQEQQGASPRGQYL
jgi:hypothetical protein